MTRNCQPTSVLRQQRPPTLLLAVAVAVAVAVVAAGSQGPLRQGCKYQKVRYLALAYGATSINSGDVGDKVSV
jgi:hypothetical protein